MSIKDKQGQVYQWEDWDVEEVLGIDTEPSDPSVGINQAMFTLVLTCTHNDGGDMKQPAKKQLQLIFDEQSMYDLIVQIEKIKKL